MSARPTLSFLALAALALAGCSGKPDPAPQQTSPTSSSTATSKPQEPAEAVSVSAGDLWVAYHDYPADADQMYGGRLLKVTGEILSINDREVVFDVFAERSGDGLPSKIICRLSATGESARKGRGFAVLGRCKGSRQDRSSHGGVSILLEDCQVQK